MIGLQRVRPCAHDALMPMGLHPKHIGRQLMDLKAELALRNAGADQAALCLGEQRQCTVLSMDEAGDAVRFVMKGGRGCHADLRKTRPIATASAPACHYGHP